MFKVAFDALLGRAKPMEPYLKELKQPPEQYPHLKAIQKQLSSRQRPIDMPSIVCAQTEYSVYG